VQRLEQKKLLESRVFAVCQDGVQVGIRKIGRKADFHIPFMVIPARSVSGVQKQKVILAVPIFIAALTALFLLAGAIDGKMDPALLVVLAVAAVIACGFVLLYHYHKRAYLSFINDRCHLELLPDIPDGQSVARFVDQMQQAKLEHMVRRYRRLRTDVREADFAGELNHLIDVGVITESDYEYIRKQLDDGATGFGFR
jgi:hypothetical protein